MLIMRAYLVGLTGLLGSYGSVGLGSVSPHELPLPRIHPARRFTHTAVTLAVPVQRKPSHAMQFHTALSTVVVGQSTATKPACRTCVERTRNSAARAVSYQIMHAERGC